MWPCCIQCAPNYDVVLFKVTRGAQKGHRLDLNQPLLLVYIFPEKFDHVTILFSDIVSFTNIAAACPAMAVVNMLNDMYQRFDAATTVHGVYKVNKLDNTELRSSSSHW